MEFASYLDELKDRSAQLRVGGLQNLDSLEREQAEALRSAWGEIDGERKQQVMRQLVELAEDNVELNFDAVFFTALEDEDGEVRREAVRGLWEYEGRDLIAPLLRLLEKDEEAEVRAEAALALGRFVLLAEYGSLKETHFKKVEQGLRQALEDELEVEEVRARALEAIGASGREWVADSIQQAYEGDEPRLRVSALHAMGRSCDTRWLPLLLEELTNEEAEMRYEAATALGSLADPETASQLAPLLYDPDQEVREATIGALGQIGGKEAKTLLRALAQDSSAGIQEAVAAALAEVDFAEDPLTTEYRV